MSLHASESGDMHSSVCRPGEERGATEGLEEVAWQGCKERQGQAVVSLFTSLKSDMQR